MRRELRPNRLDSNCRWHCQWTSNGILSECFDARALLWHFAVEVFGIFLLQASLSVSMEFKTPECFKLQSSSSKIRMAQILLCLLGNLWNFWNTTSELNADADRIDKINLFSFLNREFRVLKHFYPSLSLATRSIECSAGGEAIETTNESSISREIIVQQD